MRVFRGAITSNPPSRLTGSLPDRNAVVVPKDMKLELLGPVGCGFLTGAGAVRNRLKPHPGSSFAVFDIGAVGFAAIHWAKRMGCEKIVAIDLHQPRLDLATRFGATHTINASETNDTRAALMAVCRRGVDYAFEATGSAAVMGTAIDSLAHGGTCALAGMVFDTTRKAEFTPGWLMTNKTVTGVMMGHADVPETMAELIAHVRSGAFPIELLVAMYDFADINRAIEDSLSGKAIKPIVRMPAA
jgi:aryl-alcohol dehydrogenase